MCGEEFKEDGVALKKRDLEIRPGPQSGSLGVEMGSGSLRLSGSDWLATGCDDRGDAQK